MTGLHPAPLCTALMSAKPCDQDGAVTHPQKMEANLSLNLVRKELRRFLCTSTPEVLCLKGKWGVGKTFLWNKVLVEIRDKDSIALNSYSYISLFGLDSLDQVRYAIFENSVSKRHIGVQPSLETFEESAGLALKKLTTGTFSILKNVSFFGTKDVVGGLQSAAVLTVRNKIVCIDDFERKGKSLRAKDVLGIISQLKEQRSCKIVLILNEDALTGDDLKEFSEQQDKVIDKSLVFSPSPEECTDIALDRSLRSYEWLRASCLALEIKNIRILKRAEQVVRDAEMILGDFNPLYQLPLIRTREPNHASQWT
jgi:hypothetical protein